MLQLKIAITFLVLITKELISCQELEPSLDVAAIGVDDNGSGSNPGLPSDVELLPDSRDGIPLTTGKLAFPQSPPLSMNQQLFQQYPVVLLQPQLVRLKNRIMRLYKRLLKRQRKLLKHQFVVRLQQAPIAAPGPAFRASANLFGDNAEGGPMGQVIFSQYSYSDPVLVTINATGMPPGKHAIHIHAYGDLKEGCKSTGPHMRNILIGNVEVKDDGILELKFRSPYLALFGPNKGIIGRSIVIHEKPIEFNRFPDIRGYPITPTINEGPQQVEESAVGGIIACGIVTVTNPLA